MKRRNFKQLIALSMLSVLVLSFTAYGFSAQGTSGDPVDDPAKLGTIGTETNPIKFVDGTGYSFETWASGLYFTTDCEYSNLTAADGKVFTLKPVYGSEKTVTISAGGGKFGAEDSVEKTVNYDDATIESDKEVLSNSAENDLSAVLTGLTVSSPSSYGSYKPYFFSYEASTKNKRIFVDSSDPSKTAADGTLESCVYDTDGQSLTLVWKENEGDITKWTADQTNALSILAVRSNYTQQEYVNTFGGDSSLSYGKIDLKKGIYGADNTTYSWVLTKKDASPEEPVTANQYIKEAMDKGFDQAKLKETIKYGPQSKYTISPDELELIVYGAPTVSAVVIQ